MSYNKKPDYKAILYLLMSFFFLTSFTPNEGNQQHKKKARNIILLIGDGMGIAQIYATYTLFGQLNMLTMPVTGISKTNSADKYVTDSAAGITAIITGEKNDNSMLSIDTTGRPLKTIVEILNEKGFATGVISTCAVTHATPAGLLVHNSDRNKYEEIASEISNTNFNVLIGGGRKYFNDRKDKVDLVKKFNERDYVVVNSIDSLKKTDAEHVICFTAKDHNPRVSKGRGDMLVQSTREALRLLSRDQDGFFVMIEGSEIDWGNHERNINYVTEETYDFDKAVGEALTFAKRDSNTLVIVTADHESGGLVLRGGDLKAQRLITKFAARDLSTHGHTAVPVIVFAYGPDAELFSGFYENTEIFYKMLKALSIEPK